MTIDAAYLRERALFHRRAAAEATDPNIAAIHVDLAERYEHIVQLKDGSTGAELHSEPEKIKSSIDVRNGSNAVNV